MGAGWGFAFGSLAITGERARSAQVLLVAIADGQTWTVVAVHVIEPDPDASAQPPGRAPPITSTSLQSKTISP